MDLLAHRTIDLNVLGSLLLDFVLYPFITILLCLLSVFVVLGNLLVVSAIWHENQLHSVTNYLIASLAAADCLVGAVVMPSSIISEIIIGSWTFGSTWCDLWHSFDVLASTASIMNLCAISLDRYLAITNPISYPTKMTPKRVALLIVSLWTCSSLISFPAIAWWRAVGDGPLQKFQNHPTLESAEATSSNSSTISSMASQSDSSFEKSLSPPSVETPMNDMNSKNDEQILYRCVFTDDTYYLLFSSIVSFYGPLCVMLYAYYRIYKAAVQQTRFLKYGSKQVMIGTSKRNKRQRNFIAGDQSNHGTNEKYGLPETTLDGVSTTDNYDTTHLVLRAHRGGGNSTTTKSIHAENNSSTSRTDQRSNRKDNHSTNSESMVRISFDDETQQQETSTQSEQTNLSSKLIDLKSQDNHKRISTRSESSAIERRGRIELIAATKKDNKIRIGCQRFDSINENVVESECHPSNVAEINQSLMDENSYKNIEDLSTNKQSDRSSIEFVKQQQQHPSAAAAVATTTTVMTNQNPIKSKNDQTNTMIGKSLIASIKKRSNNVDVSIADESPINVNHVMTSSRQPKHNFFHTRTVGNWSSEMSKSKSRSEDQQKRNSGDKFAGANQRVAEKTSTNENVNGQDDSHNGDDEDDDDDDDESLSITSSGSSGSRSSRSSSSSSGSDTYGTGSIVSVLVKPKLPDQANQENTQMQVKKSCDRMDKHGMRRALSVGDAEQRTTANRSGHGDIESGTVETVHESNHVGRDNQKGGWAKKLPSSITMPIKNNNHRASCSYAIGTPAIIQEFRKNSKTFDIRFWVRKSRNRSTTGNDNRSNDTIDLKPPPSLVPLMMMNSDTSTDSSIMAGETKRNIGTTTTDCLDSKSSVIANVGRLKNNSKRSNDPRKGLELSNELDGVADSTNSVVGLGTTLRQKSVPDLNGKNDSKHLARNLSFKDDKEQQNKVQMLYYDSDKLIQSIVNLTDIHYIDCTNRGAQSISKTKENYTTQATTICRPEKSSYSTIDQSQISHSQDDDRVSAATVARQRSTGKKLTKLAKERKAAKTLGIVVGVFILCWLPFFVVNIVVALCGTNCIYKPQILLAIVTWLGWLNSAMNPVIYACWSRDFRRAFRRVLCTWVECLYPYDNGKLARKLRLKKRSSNYSAAHEAQLQRTASRNKLNNSNSITTSAPLDRNGLSHADDPAKRANVGSISRTHS